MAYGNIIKIDLSDVEIDLDLIVDKIKDHYQPSDVFDESTLEDYAKKWAKDNGYEEVEE